MNCLRMIRNQKWSFLIERNLHTVSSIPIEQNLEFQAVILSIPDLHMTTKGLHCIDHIKIRSHFFDVNIFQIFRISENFTIKTKSDAQIRNFLKFSLWSRLTFGYFREKISCNIFRWWNAHFLCSNMFYSVSQYFSPYDYFIGKSSTDYRFSDCFSSVLDQVELFKNS